MRKIQKLGLAAPVVLAIAGISGGSVSAASQPRGLTMLTWQAEIGHVAAVGSGCFHASFPTLVWHAAKCVTAPERPLAPVLGTASKGGPQKVGDGDDYSAVVSGLITKATGTFTGVSAGITEKGQIDGSGPKKANEYSLQLNTEFFSGSPACAGARNPANCLAWQQFVYTTDQNLVFMQYWLIDYNATCPSGWFTDSTDCYTNSSASLFSGSALTASSLATLSLTASATAGGNDEEVVSNDGQATMVTGKDSKVDLAPNWNTSEWDVFGDAGGGEAYFGKNDALEAVTTLTATSSAAPSCATEGFTGETNNLKLAATPALGSVSSPTMGSKQTDGKPGTASCASAS
jgi:hypothetical protein